jgi:hypothetical protein
MSRLRRSASAKAGGPPVPFQSVAQPRQATQPSPTSTRPGAVCYGALSKRIGDGSRPSTQLLVDLGLHAGTYGAMTDRLSMNEGGGRLTATVPRDVPGAVPAYSRFKRSVWCRHCSAATIRTLNPDCLAREYQPTLRAHLGDRGRPISVLANGRVSLAMPG